MTSKGTQRITSDKTGTSFKVAQLHVLGSKVIKPSAKGKRKIQGVGGGRTPLGKDMT